MDSGLNVDGRESGLFHVHIGMAGYGVYEFTGSQTIIGGTLHLAIGMALS